jgi:hypothetical protein
VVSGRGPERWDALGLEIKPWREAGDHILVCPNRHFGMRGLAMPQDWEQRTLKEMRAQTKRPIRVRPHPNGSKPARPLAEDLVGAWCVVIWASSCGVHALLAGIPVSVLALVDLQGRLGRQPESGGGAPAPERGRHSSAWRGRSGASRRSRVVSPSVTCYITPAKPKSRLLCSAFADGAGGKALESTTLSRRAGDVLRALAARRYGRRRATIPRAPGTTLDNAYFDGGAGRFYRIARNALQASGSKRRAGTG